MTGERARAALDLRWQAQCIIDQLLAPLDPACSVGMLDRAYLGPVWLANFDLAMARHQAENRAPAQPDVPGADIYCDFCGSTTDLFDDSIDPSTGQALGDPVWACADLDGCLARRAERYPDNVALIQAATDKLDTAMAAAAPALVALSSVQAALHQAASGDQVLALTEPRSAAQPRPAPSRAAAQANRWSHTLTSPAHRAHLLSRAR